MSSLEIHQFPCLQDNYGVLIHDVSNGVTASIDAPDAAAVRRALTDKGWQLTHLFVTHHHADHTGGNLSIKASAGCTIFGPKGEADKIPGIDRAVGEGDTISFGSFQVHVLDTPGHTAGHVCYWIPAAGVAFAGDTLFAMGCGRVLEASHQVMWNSLRKLMRLPPATRIYCGHEYTVANARFALTIEPDNQALRQRLKDCEALRAQGKPTLPTRIDVELETNPFLRVGVTAVREHLGMLDEPDWKVFSEIRERKNRAA